MGSINNSVKPCLCYPSYQEIQKDNSNEIIVSQIYKLNEEKIIKLQKWWKELYKQRINNSKFPTYYTNYTFKNYDEPGVETNLEMINIRPVKPGVEINLDMINISPIIKRIEKKLGSLVVEEKELIKFIKDNKDNLKKSCLKYPNGTIYFGYFNKLWEREGYGVAIFPDGSKYQGFYSEDKMKGKGRLININGDYYEGEFINNKANINGKLVSKMGGTYVGEFLDGEKHGTGIEHFPDGSIYEGTYFKGAKTGKGKFTWRDRSVYEGEFSNNVINGFGLCKWNNGVIYQGQWLNGKIEGKGILIYPDRRKFIGEHKNNLKCGLGVLIWPNNKKYEGEWFNGRFHGYGILSKHNIKIYGKWEYGQMISTLNKDSEIIKSLTLSINKLIYREFNTLDEFNFKQTNSHFSNTTVKESSINDDL
jgi:hypothetical protein